MRDYGSPKYRNCVIGLFLVGLCLGGSAVADEPAQIAVKLQDHRFVPAEIHVQAGKATVLVVTNEDATAEEFDSTALKVEKVIAAGHYATIRLRPLGPGRYPFMGEFHPETAIGAVVAE
ncbi:MAG: cupredoxin domain-containing protein [Rhodopila sp.]|nr:cupredoxin domain-containing protein [Rhodopila sp.]